MAVPVARDDNLVRQNVLVMDLALLSAEIANGMYKKPIDLSQRKYITSRCPRIYVLCHSQLEEFRYATGSDH